MISRLSLLVSLQKAVSMDIGGILRGSVVKCLTRNKGVLCLSCTGSTRFFVGISLGKTLQRASLVLMKLRIDMNNVSCCCDMNDILLKAV